MPSANRPHDCAFTAGFSEKERKEGRKQKSGSIWRILRRVKPEWRPHSLVQIMGGLRVWSESANAYFDVRRAGDMLETSLMSWD